MKNKDLEICAKELVNVLKKRENLFESFNILFPSKSLEDYFKTYWLKSGNGVLMNVNFYTFDMLLNTLFNNSFLLSNEEYKLLTLLTLEENIDDIKLISNYLNKTDINYQNKLYDLASSLVTLFNDYDEDLLDLENDLAKIEDLVLNKASKFNLFTKRHIIKNFKFKNIGRIHTFGFVRYTKLEELLLLKYQQILNFDLDTDVKYDKSDIVVSRCPSKKKEIEILHSKICNLLLEEENKYSDFLVLSQNILEYETAIKEVFEQDNKHFLSVPYNIKQKGNQESDTFILFDVLLKSLSNKIFTRLDLCKILGLEWIQKSRSITKEDVDNIINVIIKTNVYNDLDLDNLKNRLIVSKFANIDNFKNSIVCINNKEYIPYTNMSLDNDLMLKFIDLISDISSFLNFFKIHTIIKIEDLDTIERVINKLVLFKDSIEEENFELFKINKFINNLRTLNIDNFNFLNFRNFILDILKNTSKYTFKKNIGITFDSFNDNVVNKYKYVFFIGLSSNNFPNLSIQSELDLRDKSDEYENIKKSFILTEMNSEYFFVSYESEDLKSGEEYYPSLILNELFNVINEDITIDEKREYKELFTRGEFKNKGYDLSLYSDLNIEEINSEENSLYKQKDYLKTVDIKKFSDFLDEPFSFKTKQLFPYNDETFSKIEEEFRPYKIDILEYNAIFDDLVSYIYEHGINNRDIEKLFKYYLLSSKLPSLNISTSKLYFEELVNTIIGQIELLHNNSAKLVEIEPVELSLELNNIIITSEKKVFFKEEDSNLTYIDLVNTENVKLKNYLKLYVKSLLDICTKEEKEYDIKLVLIDKNLKENMKYTFKTNPSESKELLCDIFKNMYDYTNIFVMPSNFLTQNLETIDEFFDKLDGEYKYFKDKKMFNKYIDFGYSYNNFKEEFNNNKAKMKNFILFELKDKGNNK